MRLHALFPAGLVLLAACAPALENHYTADRSVRVYENRTPACPVEYLGTVQGASIYDLQREAFAKKGQAVIVNTARSEGTPSAPLSGLAVAFAGGRCEK